LVGALKTGEAAKAEDFKTTVEKVATDTGIKSGQIMQALRVSVTGAGSGPDLMITMEILGREEVANRIEKALASIKVKAG
jgi:glutamyl-tRNA synthetase